MQTSADHETLFVVCYVELHVDFSSKITFWVLRPSLSSVKGTRTVSTFSTNEIS